TGPVIIDLNNHTLETSHEFLESHVESIFSIIELGNSPFPGDIDGDGFGTAGSSFPGDTGYHEASNVVIQNGVLKRSSHWGIHGNNNANMILRNLQIRDWEVAGISLNALRGGDFINVDIVGCEHRITIRSVLTGILRTQKILQQIVEEGDTASAEAARYDDRL